MTNIQISHALIFAAVLFVIGAAGVMLRRNLVFVLMSVEIMLNAAGVAFVAASAKWGQPDVQVFVSLILVGAAAEVAVGLTLLLRIYHNWRDVDSDQVSEMSG